jgi:hypothetical protein
MCAKALAALPECKEAAVAATEHATSVAIERVRQLARSPWWRRNFRRIAGLFGTLLAGSHAHATELPEDRAEAMLHLYEGGGVTASGPALLVRKRLLDKVSLSASYYMDMVSNASIDVVTTASPYHETRNEYSLGADYAVRDALISFSTTASREPDYDATTTSLDVAQEVFGGMTTISMGYTRGHDQVGKKGTPGYFDAAYHWQYRLGLTQVLTPRWIASANLEALVDDGYLGSPYRVARVFGAAVPERDPRTRSARAVKLRAVGDIGSAENHDVVRAEYRYYWDTWNVRANTFEAGYSRYLGSKQWLMDANLRYNTQQHALFYSDNAASETAYISRNRQLSSFHSIGPGGKLTYTFRQVPGLVELRAVASWQWLRFQYSDFTDIRTGKPYAFNANIAQLMLSATF